MALLYRGSRRVPVSLVGCLALLLAGCPDPVATTPGADGTPDAVTGDSPQGDTVAADVPSGPPPLSSGTTRRLSKVELGNSIQRLTGVTPTSLELIPPDSLGHAYDRVVNSQSMSRAHRDAFFEIATEVAMTLIGEKRLDYITASCPDAILPPTQPETTASIIGASLGLGPEWAVTPAADPSHIDMIYAPEPIATYAHNFETPGTYTIALDMDVGNGPIDWTDVYVGGVLAHNEGSLDGPVVLSFQVDISTEGPTVIQWRMFTEPLFNNLAITFKEVRITGPLDAGAVVDADARRACAEALVDELGPRAFRRPLTTDERTRLVGLYDQSTGAAALRMVLQGILANPLLLYVIEVGAPIDGAPGIFQLDAWEVATRLSYALCEGPPDDELRTAAAAGELQTPAQLEAQARRLIELPCAHATILRFYQHWLHLNKLANLNKSPEAFPLWTDDLRAGLDAESARYLEEMFYAENADLQLLFTADYAWPDPRSAILTGVAASTGPSVTLPSERRGVLTLPGLMAVTAPFESTSPVERGVFVAEQLLCQPLPPPPDELMVVPPIPDPNLTTKERWDQHSSDPACSGCHNFIDPVGFSFEGFDGIGVYRTMENGKPVDTTGGLPQLGIPDGDLNGAVDIGAALATSQELASCLATQYLRFALGRLDGAADVTATGAVAAVLTSNSMKEGIIALFSTESFLRRYEPEEVSP